MHHRGEALVEQVLGGEPGAVPLVHADGVQVRDGRTSDADEMSTTGTGDAIAAMAWATSVVGAMIAMPSTP